MRNRQNQGITVPKRRHTGRRRFLSTAPAAGLLACGLVVLAASPASAFDAAGEIDLLRPQSGTLIRSIPSAYDAQGDSIAMGDITNDGFEEIVIANAGGSSENGRVDVLDAFGATISSFGTAYDDSGDRLAVGDITNDGSDEVVIANAGGSSEGGRIDIHDLFGATISSFGTAYDDDGDAVAVGDVTGDGAEEVVIANSEGGERMDVHDLFGDVIASFGNTGYDGDDTVEVGDVNGDGRAEIVVANTEGGGRIDVFGGTGGVLSSFSSGVANPKVLVAEMTGDSAAEIAVVPRFATASPQSSEDLVQFDFFGAQIRRIDTTFTAIGPNRVADGIALGHLNAGPRAEVIVANV
ncbi:MAG: hypothetical protein ACRDTC_04050 [Pseudonocardiaceae bacterium]